jgi:RNA polymerase sigma factor (sigma-70 family)
MSEEDASQASGGQRQRERAFEQLVKLHRPELTRYAFRQLGEHASLAEDVVQEALLNAHRAIATGTRPEHPRAWLFTIVRNAAVNAARAVRPAGEIEEHHHGTPDQTVSAAVEQSEWIDWLMGAIGDLPARQREALVGHAFEGRSYRELADRQRTTVSAVKSLIGRARRALAVDSSLPAAGAGAPLAAGARAFRALLARSPLAGKAGGAKGLVGALAQVVLAATVTTGVLMAVHGGGPSAVLASTGPARSAGASRQQYHAPASLSPHHAISKRARERRLHREAHHAVSECLHDTTRRHYRAAALQYAARHLPTSVREYTECERELRSAALRAAKRQYPHSAGSRRDPTTHSPARRARTSR